MANNSHDKETFQIGVKRGRTYGGEYVEFSMQQIVELSSGVERREALARLAAQVEDQIKVWENVELPKLNLAKDNYAGKNEPANTLLTIPVQSIQISNDGKGRRYRVMGGQFIQWGVPIYDDALANVPFDLTKLDYGEHHYGGEYDAVVEMVADKPKRVRRIEKL